jgi:hypothetical protein
VIRFVSQCEEMKEEKKKKGELKEKEKEKEKKGKGKVVWVGVVMKRSEIVGGK